MFFEISWRILYNKYITYLSCDLGGSITSYHALKNVQIEQDPSLGKSSLYLTR